jgi:hypothetical protein
MTTSTENTTTFAKGATYNFSLIGDSSIVSSVRILKLTPSTATFVVDGNFLKKSRIYTYEGVQFIYPDGKYSKCPVCKASNLA